ncbi:hypothetical protein AAMO2058_001411800 [Amorphochlora amoebiformis]
MRQYRNVLVLIFAAVGIYVFYLANAMGRRKTQIRSLSPTFPPPWYNISTMGGGGGAHGGGGTHNRSEGGGEEKIPEKGNWRALLGAQEARILITGAAGFIGAHLSMRLRLNGRYVVGIDSMNNYYDVRLKVKRRDLAIKAGTIFIQGDVCNKTLLSELFHDHRFTHIVHLAAQAGVRYSKKHPIAYGEANVLCTITLLEQAKNASRMPIFLYASSSSVYGRSKNIPFKESQRTDRPISIYAATKLATEHVAYAYHELYKMRCTGLRFFTVYGPLGRPDMATWMWAKSIKEGKALTLYETSGKLLRDFTYIDDIIDGVVAAIEFSADWAIFNLGRGEPQNVPDLISALEKELNKSAIVNKKPLPPGDVPLTYADTSLARMLLGYNPRVSILEGVRKFVTWFKSYEPEPLPSGFRFTSVDPALNNTLGIVA